MKDSSTNFFLYFSSWELIVVLRSSDKRSSYDFRIEVAIKEGKVPFLLSVTLDRFNYDRSFSDRCGLKKSWRLINSWWPKMAYSGALCQRLPIVQSLRHPYLWGLSVRLHIMSIRHNWTTMIRVRSFFFVFSLNPTRDKLAWENENLVKGQLWLEFSLNQAK